MELKSNLMRPRSLFPCVLNRVANRRTDSLVRGPCLDCYWVGSLDFNFFGKSRGFPLNPQKDITFCREVNSNQVVNQAGHMCSPTSSFPTQEVYLNQSA